MVIYFSLLLFISFKSCTKMHLCQLLILFLLLRNYNNSDAFYNKPRLLVLIASIVISLSIVPFILPHVSHTHMIYHILLHIVALIISQFLAVVL